MKAEEARALAQKNSEAPDDIVLLIKKAARKGKTSITIMFFERYVYDQEIDALKLLGYKTKELTIRECQALKISWA